MTEAKSKDNIGMADQTKALLSALSEFNAGIKQELKETVSTEIRMAMQDMRNDSQREIGEINRRIDRVERDTTLSNDRCGKLFERHDEQQTQIDDLRDDHNQRKGMMKLLVILCGASTLISLGMAAIVLLAGK